MGQRRRSILGPDTIGLLGGLDEGEITVGVVGGNDDDLALLLADVLSSLELSQLLLAGSLLLMREA